MRKINRSSKSGKFVDDETAKNNPDTTQSAAVKTRYFFDTDGDCHWYLIPEQWRDLWNKLAEDEEGWADPEWYKFETCRLGGGVSGITFENPRPTK